MDKLIEDDAKKMLRIFNKQFELLAIDHLLNKKEIECVSDKINNTNMVCELVNMYSSDNREEYARQFILPIIEEVVKNRQIIKLPNYEKYIETNKLLLEKVVMRQL